MCPSIRLLFLVVLPYSSYVVGSAVMIYPTYEVHQVPLAPPYTNTYYTPFHGNTKQERSGPDMWKNRYKFSNNNAVLPIGNMYNNEETNHSNNERNEDDVDRYHHTPTSDLKRISELLHRNFQDVMQPNYPPSSSSDDDVVKQKDAQQPSTKITFQSPDLTNLLKPITIKATSTSNGLMDLVTAFLSSSTTGNLQMKGFKDLLINSIIRPLLVAKGGIKTLISKLTIPLIALLLINLEVLVTVWWLWEDCPQPKYQPPPYPHPDHSYNNYNTSYRK